MKIITISAIWCPACLIMRPRFEEVSRIYSSIESISYDLDLDEEASKYNAGHILPVFILLDNDNNELGRIIGEQKIDKLINLIEEHLSTKE